MSCLGGYTTQETVSSATVRHALSVGKMITSKSIMSNLIEIIMNRHCVVGYRGRCGPLTVKKSIFTSSRISVF